MLKMREAAAKMGRVAWWRGYVSWAHPLANRLAARWDRPSRLVRWPLPWMAPFRQAELHLTRENALGDVLLSTPALRELKRRNPACRITLYTDYPELVEGLPFIDCVCPSGQHPPQSLWLNYEWSRPPRRHLARIIGGLLGLDVQDVRPSCVVRSDLVERYRREWGSLPRPIVVVNRRAGPFTPNKDWPDEYWDHLVPRLAARGTVIDVGGVLSAEPSDGPAGSYKDLRGRTTLPELVAAIAAADLHVAPITGTVHIAAAVGVPSVVIYGGYEPPVCTDYPGNIGLYSPVECAPCWLQTPCPFSKKCLYMITCDQIEAALERLWEDRRRLTHSNRPAVALGALNGGSDPRKR